MKAAPSDGQKDTAVTTILTPKRLAEYRAHYPNRDGYCEACVIGHDGHYAPFPCLPYLLAAEVSLLRAQIGDVNDLHQRVEVGIHDLRVGSCKECGQQWPCMTRLLTAPARDDAQQVSPDEADTDPCERGLPVRIACVHRYD